MPTSITTAVAEWYGVCALRDALAASPSVDRFLKSHDSLLNDISTYAEMITDKLFVALRDYLTIAAFGEARHAYSKANGFISEIPYESERHRTYRMAKHFDPVKCLPHVIKLFNDIPWPGNGYGGKPWGRISEAALMGWKSDLTKMAWIDHVVDLSHNSGLAFDKFDAHIVSFRSSVCSNCAPEYYRGLLDYKASAKQYEDTIKRIQRYWGTSRFAMMVYRAKALKLVDMGDTEVSCIYYKTIDGDCTLERNHLDLAIKTLIEYVPIKWGDDLISPPVRSGGNDYDEDEDEGDYDEGKDYVEEESETSYGEKEIFNYDVEKEERE